ncbi:nitrogen fixation protein [Heliobacillus mobilis]|uniref:Hut operon positive regulatory protein n=2 Tax=Heliobacterium mobile TaxID=28064 RepID=A0A6I3SMY5_HELMO|nr:nitrogen fixation protein [Heliobacterium mobile]
MENISIERAAIKLVMCETREEELEIRRYLQEYLGFYNVVTEIGGIAGVLMNSGKLINSVIAAAINEDVIRNTSQNVHAVVNATLDAMNGVFHKLHLNASVALSVSVISDGGWVAVGIFGKYSLHPKIEHCRVGLGFMNLS